MSNNLYGYLKKLFPETKALTKIATVVSKNGTSLVVEDASGRRINVKNFTGNDYTVGTTVFLSDNVVIGRVATSSNPSVYYV